MTAGVMDNQKTEIPTLAKFLTAQTSYVDCRAAFVSAGIPDTCFNFDSDGVLVRVSPLFGASQRIVPTSLGLLIPHLYR